VSKGPGSQWQLEFLPEIQAEREPILAALDRAMDERTVEAVREAQTLAWMEAQKDREEMEAWKRHKAEVQADAAHS